jgi:hypothetical protein
VDKADGGIDSFFKVFAIDNAIADKFVVFETRAIVVPCNNVGFNSPHTRAVDLRELGQ